ncbi:hypothetical protein BV375_05180 [Nostoc sp. 106C]|nr:hypothetical protein BV375_05180 [Nostoc sp. 106C]
MGETPKTALPHHATPVATTEGTSLRVHRVKPAFRAGFTATHWLSNALAQLSAKSKIQNDITKPNNTKNLLGFTLLGAKKCKDEGDK